MNTLIIIGAIVIIAFFIWCICQLAPFYKKEGWNFFNAGIIIAFVVLIAIVVLAAAYFIGCWGWLTYEVMMAILMCALCYVGVYLVALAFNKKY